MTTRTNHPRNGRKKPKAQKTYGTGLQGFPELWNRKGAEVSLRIDSELLAAAESEDPKATKKGSRGGTAKNRFHCRQAG